MMIRYFLYSLLCVFLFSCKTVVTGQNNLAGKYFEKGEDFEYTLVLKEDKTFTLSKVYISHGQSFCEGKWIKKEDKNLILNCSEVKDPVELLSSRYMSKRDYVIKILNNSTIELEGITLKKIN